MREYAVIGGGIGGCSCAALLNASGKDVVVFEKEPYLGGCASTFERNHFAYNAGATTFCGYSEGRVVKKLFNQVGVVPHVIESDPAIVVIQGEKVIPRYKDIERFINVLNVHYPHPKHYEFWHLIKNITTEFYETDGYYYSNASWAQKLYSLRTFYPLLQKFWNYLFRDAKSFILHFYANIDPDFLDFLDAQILIVTQAKSDSINFLNAALALGYTFESNYYALGGMGKVCESLTENIADVRLSHPITKIEKLKKGFRLSTSHYEMDVKNLIMGTSHFESSVWFTSDKIKKYYRRYTSLNNHQSAFVLYMNIPNTQEFYHHYQIISKITFPYTISQSLFVSISDPRDTELSRNNTLSITASIHTNTSYWLGISDTEYKERKEILSRLIEASICDTLSINKDTILRSFAATPKTFGRYLNRTQLGGVPMNRSNFLPFLPSNDTPIDGLYQVGDTSFAAQGWPGVVMGSFNLLRLLDE
ncbi:FAD-dependent oxidoreductase [Sulfuricurvum sp.]|uniref:phytoene desaturase family protein n=1 Tax=Sulfuricurvum sp. TaxID=2025608 RepID=UPI0026057D95|nr:FAD-dependent oxidoreductase [Sulfuricurvum sp.]MDD2780766.1 NAD(P)-binding protein [Sulfuricurvum sp.]